MSFRCGEQNDVLANRRTFLARHNLEPEQCVMPDLEHGNTVAVVDEHHRGVGMTPNAPTIQAEALITNTQDLVLCIVTADCFPVAYADPVRRVIALAHLGWKPAGKLLAKAVVEKMTGAFGSKPSDIYAYIGPGIHPDSYKKTEIQQQNDPLWQPYLHPVPGSNETSIDLLTFVKDQIRDAGVPAAQISTSTADTATDTDTFSHYRARRTNEPKGRFLTVLTLV